MFDQWSLMSVRKSIPSLANCAKIPDKALIGKVFAG